MYYVTLSKNHAALYILGVGKGIAGTTVSGKCIEISFSTAETYYNWDLLVSFHTSSHGAVVYLTGGSTTYRGKVLVNIANLSSYHVKRKSDKVYIYRDAVYTHVRAIFPEFVRYMNVINPTDIPSDAVDVTIES